MALNLWPVPHGLEDLLNPIGVTGSNPNKVNSKCQLPEHDAHPLFVFAVVDLLFLRANI